MSADNQEYVGFWARFGATLIDTVLLCAVIWPPLYAIYGTSYWTGTEFVRGLPDLLLSWVLPAVVVIAFWVKTQATPGKMAVSARIVDADSGGKPSTKQMIGRYFGYFISTLPLGLGFLWVAFNRRKQGWHDLLAGTVVVRRKQSDPA